MIGRALSHYEIRAPLGAGGMGEVYRARDTKLERDVAIKVFPDDLAADPDRLARFEREAKLLAALSHALLFRRGLGGGRLWSAAADGSGDEQVLFDEPVSWGWDLWEGKLIYMRREGPTTAGILIRDLATGETTVHATVEFASASLGPQFSPAVSPDGRFILYSGLERVGSDLRLVENFGASR